MGWLRIDTTCFRFEISKVHKTWYEARKICRDRNGSLAVLSSESTLRGLSASLNFYVTMKQISKDIKMFLGLKYVPQFRWTEDGEPVLKSLWFPGHPDVFRTKEYVCAAIKFTSFGLRLLQVSCKKLNSFICQQDERKSSIFRQQPQFIFLYLHHAIYELNIQKIIYDDDDNNNDTLSKSRIHLGNLAYQKPVRTNASASFGVPSLALDGSYATCFETKKVKNSTKRV